MHVTGKLVYLNSLEVKFNGQEIMGEIYGHKVKNGLFQEQKHARKQA